MYKLRLHLWTPAFAGGATARAVDPVTPLRAPAVRGALRWWFRAAASAVLFPDGESDEANRDMVDALRLAERELFGDTTRRSRVIVFPGAGGKVVRVSPDRNQWGGLRYLGYGLFEQATADAVVTLRESLPPPTPEMPGLGPIELRLGLRPAGRADSISDSHRRLLAATVWLWLHLGGVGARARRGWGSIGLDADADKLLADMPALRTDGVKPLIDSLLAGLDRATEIFRSELSNIGVRHSGQGTSPHQAIRTIDGIENVTILPGDHSSPIVALEEAGKLLQAFRSSLARPRRGMGPLPDYFAVKSSLQDGSTARRVDRAAFGLPLPFYFRSLGGRKTNFAPADKDGEISDRLASPLLFRVHRIASGGQKRYVTAIVNLADRADPMGGRRLKQQKDGKWVPTEAAVDKNILRDFIAWALQEASRPRGGQRT